jgi:hypothetical protein
VERFDGALPALLGLVAAQWPKEIGKRSDRAHVKGLNLGIKASRPTSTDGKTVLATSIAAGRWKWNPLVARNRIAGIALRGARHSKPKCIGDMQPPRFKSTAG